MKSKSRSPSWFVLSIVRSVPASLARVISTAFGEKGPPREVATGFARGRVLKPQVDGGLLSLDPAGAILGGASIDIPVIASASPGGHRLHLGT